MERSRARHGWWHNVAKSCEEHWDISPVYVRIDNSTIIVVNVPQNTRHCSNIITPTLGVDFTPTSLKVSSVNEILLVIGHYVQYYNWMVCVWILAPTATGDFKCMQIWSSRIKAIPPSNPHSNHQPDLLPNSNNQKETTPSQCCSLQVVTQQSKPYNTHIYKYYSPHPPHQILLETFQPIIHYRVVVCSAIIAVITPHDILGTAGDFLSPLSGRSA